MSHDTLLQPRQLGGQHQRLRVLATYTAPDPNDNMGVEAANAGQADMQPLAATKIYWL
jgi:hypothetical protein